MLRYVLPLLLALAIVPIAPAADLALGPETPLTPPSTTPAPFDQHIAGVASNGRDFLVIWRDRRSIVPSVPSNPTPAPLYVSRVDTAGRPANPFGTRLFDAISSAVLVRTSTAYAVLWSAGAETDFMPLDDDGNRTSAPKRLTDGYVLAAASNGHTIFVIHGTQSGGQIGSIFTTDGTLVYEAPLDPKFLYQYPEEMRPVVLPGGSYGFVAQTWTCPGQVPCVVEPTLTIMSESGTVTEKPLGPVEQRTRSAVAFGGGRLLLAWLSDSGTAPLRSVGYRLYDTSGNALMADRKTIVSTNNIPGVSGEWAPSVGWDGRQFVVAWQWPTTQSDQSGEISAVRVSADGAQLDPSPRLVGNTLGNPPWFVSNGIDQLMLWDTFAYQSSDIAVRAMPSFDALDSAPTTIMPESAALQHDLQIAANGNSRMAVWREGEPLPAIVAATAAGAPIVVSPAGALDQQSPAIAASGDEYLVVWREVGSWYGGPAPPMRILGKRLRSDGTLLDRDPIVISNESSSSTYSGANTIAVASDGKDFLAVWIGGDQLKAARVTAAGAVLDASGIDLGAGYGTANSPRALWNGSRYLVAWIADPSCKVCLFPPVGPPVLFLGSVQVDLAGSVTAASTAASGSFGYHLALGRGPDGLMAAWSASPDKDNLCITTMGLHSDGTPAGPMHSIECTAPTWPDPFPDIDVAWDGGGSFVVAWTKSVTSGTDARAIRVGGDGSPRDAAPFEVSPVASPSFQPALASGNALVVAYGRIAYEPQYGGVARLFVRTLAPTAPLVRRRVTR